MFGPSIPAPSSLLCRSNVTLLVITPEAQSNSNLFDAMSHLPLQAARRHNTLQNIESLDRLSDEDVITDCATGILGPFVRPFLLVKTSNNCNRSVED